MRSATPLLVLLACAAAAGGLIFARQRARAEALALAAAQAAAAGTGTSTSLTAPRHVVLGEHGGTRWDPSRHQGPVHVRLEPSGPREARVWLEQELLGRLAVDEAGRHSGEAIGRMMGVARLLAAREVLVESPPELPPELPMGLLGLLRQGGVLKVRLNR